MRSIIFKILIPFILLLLCMTSCTSGKPGNGKPSTGTPKPFDPVKAHERLVQADQKVFIFGVDGMTWSKLNAFRKAGLMPNFDRLIREGACGHLESVNPMFSISIWTTLVTGVDFDTHGVLYFYKIGKNGTMLPYTSLDRKVKALWNIMDDVGEPSGWVSWWGSWPAEPVKGFNITNYFIADFGFRDIQEASLFYPPEMSDDLRKLKESYTVEWAEKEADDALGDTSFINKDELKKDYWGDFKYGSLNWVYCNKKDEFLYNFLRNNYRNDALSVHAGLDMMKKYDTHLTGIYTNGVDGTSHKFWKYDTVAPNFGSVDPNDPNMMAGAKASDEELKKYGKVLSSYYAYVDSLLGEIRNSVDDKTNIVIVSDHGFAYVPKSNYISLNALLYELGFTQFKDNLEKVDLTKSFAHEITIKPWDQRRFLRINVRSNDFKDWDGSPLGAVKAGKEEADVRTRLINDLKSLKLKNKGIPLFVDVHQPDWREKNENEGQGDVVAILNRQIFDSNFKDDIILPNGKTLPLDMVAIRNYHSGNHDIKDGVFFLVGPAARKGTEITGAKVFDVTPTILAILGLPADKSMLSKGKVLTDAIDPAFLEKFPPEEIDSYGEFHHQLLGKQLQGSEAEQEVRKMLQGLGYLQ